jgi:hypothetical protein
MARGTNMYSLFNNKTKAINLVRGNTLIEEEVSFLLSHPKYSLFFGNNMGFSPEKFLHLKNRVATFNLIRSELEKLFNKYNKASLLEMRLNFNEANDTLELELTLATGSYNSNINVALNLGD